MAAVPSSTPTPTTPRPPDGSSRVVSVPIGRWGIAASPARIRTLLGSCVGVVLYDRASRVGGVAHVVLPSSRGGDDHPGKYADTAIPGLISDLERLIPAGSRTRLTAKIAGGACMFAASPTGAPNSNSTLNIGRLNGDAVERVLMELRIPILARDLGGGAGRHLTLDTDSGIVSVRVPGGASYEI